MVPPPATVDDRPLLAASDSRSAPAPPRLRPSGQGSAASLSPPPVASRVADAYPTRAVGGGRQHWPRPWVRVLEKRPACSRWDRLEVGPARGSPVSNRVKLRPRTVCSRAVTRFQRPEANGQTLANLCRATTDISTAGQRHGADDRVAMRGRSRGRRGASISLYQAHPSPSHEQKRLGVTAWSRLDTLGDPWRWKSRPAPRGTLTSCCHCSGYRHLDCGVRRDSIDNPRGISPSLQSAIAWKDKDP
ncbi:hypothetical protein RJ55_02079 [Drechmeria coniospora]|nr:hypothetical protein RJ55_02079 [Drechmeria coniospora]